VGVRRESVGAWARTGAAVTLGKGDAQGRMQTLCKTYVSVIE